MDAGGEALAAAVARPCRHGPPEQGRVEVGERPADRVHRRLGRRAARRRQATQQEGEGAGLGCHPCPRAERVAAGAATRQRHGHEVADRFALDVHAAATAVLAPDGGIGIACVNS